MKIKRGEEREREKEREKERERRVGVPARHNLIREGARETSE